MCVNQTLGEALAHMVQDSTLREGERGTERETEGGTGRGTERGTEGGRYREEDRESGLAVSEVTARDKTGNDCNVLPIDE